MMFGIAITFGVTSAVLFLSSDAPATAKNGTPVVRAARAPAPKADKTSKSTIKIIPAPYVTSSGGGASALIRF
jgi:hypothetical protein